MTRPPHRRRHLSPPPAGTPATPSVNRNKFNADFRPYLTEIPLGRQALALDRVELDALISSHQEWSGGIACVSMSGRPSGALRRCVVRIDFEGRLAGRPGDLVDDDQECERRVALRRCKKERLFRLAVD
jgi:hypothetical protein